MNAQIKCDEVLAQLALLLYGELSFDEEERVDSHMDVCESCRTALEREQARHRAFDGVEISPSPSLLRECREDLFERLSAEAQRPQPIGSLSYGGARGAAHGGWWDQFVDLIARPSSWLKPAAAVGLVAIGFLSARLMPFGASIAGGSFQGMSLAGLADARVRNVEPVSDGRVQIVLDETVQHTVAGRVEDQQIRRLLLTAAKDPSDPGLRAETVDILNTHAQAADVKEMLIFLLHHDQNAGVRLKAIEGLRPFAGDLEVRSALAQALLTDSNPGLRTEAIDLLTKSVTEDSDRQIVGTLQELMHRESNNYVRQRCLRALEAMNASAETY